MEQSTRLRLALLFMFVFMVGVVVGLWATKNTFKHCTEDLQYCVDTYNTNCNQRTNPWWMEVNTNGIDRLWETGNNNSENGTDTG